MAQHELERVFDRRANRATVQAALDRGMAELRDNPRLLEGTGLSVEDLDDLTVEAREEESGITGAEILIGIGVSVAGRIIGEGLVTLWKGTFWPKVQDLVGRERTG